MTLHKEDNGHECEEINLPYNKSPALIDKKLIPLIKELNKLGLITVECCQGGKGTLRDKPKYDYPMSIVFELGRNVQVEFKPLGPYDHPRLVIYWYSDGKSIFDGENND